MTPSTPPASPPQSSFLQAAAAPQAATIAPPAPPLVETTRRHVGRALDEVGAAELQRLALLHGDVPADRRALDDVDARCAAAGARVGVLTRIFNRLASCVAAHLPPKLSITVSHSLTVGIPGWLDVGGTSFGRISGTETQRRPLDVGVAAVGSLPVAFGAYAVGKSFDGAKDATGLGRQGLYGGLTAGPFAVSTTHPVLNIRTMGFYIPHLFSVSISSAGAIGGSITVPLPFLPVLSAGVGLYVEHPWCARLTERPFAIYDRVVEATRRAAEPWRAGWERLTVSAGTPALAAQHV